MNSCIIRNIRLISGSLFCFALIACDSSGPNTSEISLEKPLTQRQLTVFQDSTLRADIVMNNGPVQSFTFPPGDDFNISLSGIVLDETNTISITWIELLNGYPIELSSQTQSFFAAGIININAAHQADQFDYDEDGSNNMEERASGNCVWSAQEFCQLAGQLDVPSNAITTASTPATVVLPSVPGLTSIEASLNTTIPEPSYEFDYTNAIDLLVNGTFDESIDGWYSGSVSNERHEDGAYCMTLPVGPEPIFEPVISPLPFINLKQGSRYSIEFDARASRNTVISSVLVGWPNAHNDQYVVVTESWQSFVIHHEHTRETDLTSIGYSGIYSQTVQTEYCFDNMRLLEEQ